MCARWTVFGKVRAFWLCPATNLIKCLGERKGCRYAQQSGHSDCSAWWMTVRAPIATARIELVAVPTALTFRYKYGGRDDNEHQVSHVPHSSVRDHERKWSLFRVCGDHRSQRRRTYGGRGRGFWPAPRGSRSAPSKWRWRRSTDDTSPPITTCAVEKSTPQTDTGKIISPFR